MKISKELFETQFAETLDALLEKMATNPGVDVKRFYSMACFIENLSLFSPVLYGMLEKSQKSDSSDNQ